VFKSLINSVDVFTLVPVLVNGIGYTAVQAETIMGVISTWGLKINMIIASIATGLMVSLIPNLTASFVKKDMEDVRNKINHTLQWLLFFTIPMTIGLSILAKPVWTIFYGASELGPNVYQYYVFVALVTTLFTAAITILQLLKEYKMVFISLLSGLIVNASLNVPLLYAFDRMGLPAYYGSTTSTILGYSSCIIISLWYIHKKYQVNYEGTIKKVISILMTAMVMTVILLLLQKVFPYDSTSRLFSILYVVVYACIGVLIYFFIAFQSKLVDSVFGKANIMKIRKKFRR